MDEKKVNQKNEEMEIDLARIISVLLNKVWIIGAVAVLFAVVFFGYTKLFVTPLYQSTAKFYVNNSSFSSLSEAAFSSITSADISASRGLVKTYIAILNTRETLNDVIDYSGVKRSSGSLRGMISADAVNGTEIFQVVVTSPDPQEAEKIANAIAHILPNRIRDIIDGTSAKVVESAVVASAPSSPNFTKNTLLGFAIGMVLMIALIVIRELTDITIRTEEDVAQSCAHPILSVVPDMEAHSKGSYYYSKYGKKAYATVTTKDSKKVELVGGDISFTAAEAFKLLRTKLQFSFADEGASRVVGISSALTGEGKSLSAANLAYSTAQLGKKVLLIDCDMRRPSLAEKLPIKKAPGLSEYLAGQIQGTELIQICSLKETDRQFHVVSAGRIPPNPMELLSSVRMEKLIALLRESYDYIILDLPPVGEVGDALAAAKLTDGMLVVARQNYCDKIALNSAIRQLEFVDAKILGIVINYASEGGYAYGNKYYKPYYRRYYRSYYKKYKNSYAKADSTSKKARKWLK